MGIAGWQYKTKPDGDWSNTSATGLSYTIRNLQCDIWVRALVNDSATPTKVSFGIVNEKNPSVAGGGTLTAKYTARCRNSEWQRLHDLQQHHFYL